MLLWLNTMGEAGGQSSGAAASTSLFLLLGVGAIVPMLVMFGG